MSEGFCQFGHCYVSMMTNVYHSLILNFYEKKNCESEMIRK